MRRSAGLDGAVRGRWIVTAALIALAGGVSARSISADSLQARLDAIFDAPLWKSSRWGVKVVDLETSRVLYERDAEKAFMPASNMKLVTTAAALSALGPDFRYETKIYASGDVGPDGTLKGDLVIVGSGDPSISNRFAKDRFDDASRRAKQTGEVEPEKAIVPILQEWAKAVKDAGIRRVTGSVIADDDVFDDNPRSGSWQLSYYPEYYSAESSGLAANDNCWDVVIHPGEKIGDPARLEVPLGTRYVTFRNNIITTGSTRSRRGDDSTSPSGRADWPDPYISISRTLDGNEVTLEGTIEIGRPPYKEWGALHNGSLYAATLFAEELDRQGIEVTQGPVDCDDLEDKAQRLVREKFRLLHTHLSPPLSELVRIVNKPSQNFYADMIQRTLGVHVGGSEGSFRSGARAVRDALTSMGVAAEHVAELEMADGSGLSRQDRVTPNLIIGLLTAMDLQPEAVKKAFFDSLPVMGVDGTLRTRLRGTPAEKAVWAKTGTIGGVRALSGYLYSADNHKLAFCMIANNYTTPTSRATEAQDEALLVLLQTRVGEGATSPADGETTTVLTSAQ